MSESSRESRFKRLFQSVEGELFRYILILIPNEADGLDVLQETACSLWETFDQYDPARPFSPWARKFAYLNVMKFRLYRSRERKKRTPFSDEALQAVADEYDDHEEVLALRLPALTQCLDRLQAEDRELIQFRYWSTTSLRDLAQERGVTENRLHRRLQRIRQILQRCIEQTVSLQGHR